MNRLNNIRQLFALKNLRIKLFSGSSKVAGGSSGHANVKSLAKKKKSFWAMEEFPVSEKGYIYRESRNLQDAKNGTVIVNFLTGFIWYWIFMNFYYNSADFFGHVTYPDMAAWTDEELGIPPETD
jgi:hypothetical protein